MKTKFLSALVAFFSACSALVAAGAAAPSQPAPAPAGERIGVYDSRVISYAHFWSAPARQQREALIAAAKAAKAAGDTARFHELGAQLSAAQSRAHLEVFSTAPADDALAALQPKLAEILRAQGVTRLVSKWDEAALQAVPAANRVDVTDRLAREFDLPPERAKTMEGIKRAKPLPLEEARRLDQAGKL
jgi:hypothetical protein